MHRVSLHSYVAFPKKKTRLLLKVVTAGELGIQTGVDGSAYLQLRRSAIKMLDVSCRPCDCIFFVCSEFHWSLHVTMTGYLGFLLATHVETSALRKVSFLIIYIYMFLFRICYNLTDLTCYDFSSCRIYSPALQIFIRAIFVKTSWFLRCGNCRERTAVLAVVKYKRRLQELQGDQFSVTKHQLS